MMLKTHKKIYTNLNAGRTAATGVATKVDCWRRDVLVCFGLVNPDTVNSDTLVTSGMPGETLRDHQRSSMERQVSVYLLRHQ